MTAGSGILHDESPTERARMYRLGGPAHAIQLWVNLPSSLEFTTPATSRAAMGPARRTHRSPTCTRRSRPVRSCPCRGARSSARWRTC
jgi:redox-sensitive bicupin YhaK (pirin superfamily)